MTGRPPPRTEAEWEPAELRAMPAHEFQRYAAMLRAKDPHYRTWSDRAIRRELARQIKAAAGQATATTPAGQLAVRAMNGDGAARAYWRLHTVTPELLNMETDDEAHAALLATQLAQVAAGLALTRLKPGEETVMLAPPMPALTYRLTYRRWQEELAAIMLVYRSVDTIEVWNEPMAHAVREATRTHEIPVRVAVRERADAPALTDEGDADVIDGEVTVLSLSEGPAEHEAEHEEDETSAEGGEP